MGGPDYVDYVLSLLYTVYLSQYLLWHLKAFKLGGLACVDSVLSICLFICLCCDRGHLCRILRVVSPCVGISRSVRLLSFGVGCAMPLIIIFKMSHCSYI